MNAIALDLETTGPDPETARIVQIAIVGSWIEEESGELLGRSGGGLLVNPGVPIPEEATAVHGITDEDVADAPRFYAFAHRVQTVLEDAEYVLTYNGRTFDIPILDRHLREAGEDGVDAAEIEEVDLYRVWHELEPRTLETAVKRFCRINHEGAHDALADAEILFDVLQGMDKVLGPDRLEPPLDLYADLTTPEDAVDRYGYFRRDEDGVVRFDFGKHSGEPLADHPDYLDWMAGADFPASVIETARNEIEPHQEEEDVD